jgi:hypothetical protein
MNVHRATCSCSVELYKQWFILADFCQTGIFRGVFSVYYLTEGSAKLRCAGNIIFFKVPRSSFIRDREIEGGEIEEGGCK